MHDAEVIAMVERDDARDDIAPELVAEALAVVEFGDYHMSARSFLISFLILWKRDEDL